MACVSATSNQPFANPWEAAVDSMEAGAILIEPRDNRIQHFNDAALTMTGLTGYALAGTRPTDLFPGQRSELTGFTLECLARGRAWSMDFALAQADGPPRPVEVLASTFRQDRREFVFFVLYDLRAIRARRAEAEIDHFYRGGRPNADRFEQVFRQLERGNQLILHAAGEGIYGVDAEGKTTFLNPAAERILGWKSEELTGRLAHSVMHHSHEDGTGYPIKACPIYAAFRDGRVHRVDNEVFWRKDGSCFPVEYTSTPIREKGRLLGAVVVFRDVSEKRKSERDLINALGQVEELKRRLEHENAYLQDELRSGLRHKEIVGSSAAIRNILQQIELVAKSDATVLITGESGTGKELIARAIHDASERSARPLIRVNCASIPSELFESEFFGHAKGAFTGALTERAGRFELADGGTIFLDEVGELPLEHQAKLLRILQEKQFERVGESKTRSIDVRVIAATNRDLSQEVDKKQFREDLFFRLSVFPIESPPLRERLDDIPALAQLFLERASERAKRSDLQVSLANVDRLKHYHWPGNIRELENVIERAVITAVDGRLRLHVPNTLGKVEAADAAAPANNSSSDAPASGREVRLMTESERKAMERAQLEEALKACRGRVSGPNGAAERLGVKPTTLYSRIKRFDIDIKHYK
jgi:PAS domain S-box-containing protein